MDGKSYMTNKICEDFMNDLEAHLNMVEETMGATFKDIQFANDKNIIANKIKEIDALVTKYIINIGQMSGTALTHNQVEEILDQL